MKFKQKLDNQNNTFSLLDSVNITCSQNVSLGENATFLCEGYGSYIYWFIDGKKIKNMTMQEKKDRALIEKPVNDSHCGSGFCYQQMFACSDDLTKSKIILAGSCLNNNTEKYIMSYILL